MKAIWKYAIEVTGIQTISMPKGAKVLTVQMHGTSPCIWAEVDVHRSDSAEDLQARHFEVFGTGHPMKEGESTYIGTFQLHGGNLVFHVYERL